jgi:hypothetical protein
MKVTGFSFIRNGIIYDYPFIEAIQSILPLCDAFVVAVGNSDDETEAAVAAINPAKIRIIPTVWDDTLREPINRFKLLTQTPTGPFIFRAMRCCMKPIIQSF